MAEDEKAGKDVSHYLKQIRTFREELEEAEKNYLRKNINVLDETTPEKPLLILDEKDREFLERYYNQVYLTRPEMLKHREEEVDYDMDFQIDSDNYDPWKEYQLIYKKIFEKGRAYWLIKALPYWKFLQIGRPEGIEYNGIHDNNYKRPNMRDSIFTLVTIDRYFEERKTKAALYRGHSQAIRI
jgi:hypothetical protein